MRELMQLEVLGVRLCGTRHRESSSAPVRRPATLVLNFGDIRRAGPADLSAHLADELADRGYPAFRFDLPGLGDTPGELPEYQETYWRFVESGGQSRWVCGLIDALKRRFAYEGFVVGGLCGGATTAIYTAEARPADVVGIFLLEPSVRRTAEVPGDQMPGQPRSTREVLVGYASETVARTRRWAESRPVIAPALGAAVALKRRFKPPVSGVDSEAPAHGAALNEKLMKSWSAVRAMHVPTLMIHAPRFARQICDAMVPNTCPPELEMIELEHTNHLLTSGNGKSRTIEIVSRWMQENIPLNRETIMDSDIPMAANERAA